MYENVSHIPRTIIRNVIKNPNKYPMESLIESFSFNHSSLRSGRWLGLRKELLRPLSEVFWILLSWLSPKRILLCCLSFFFSSESDPDLALLSLLAFSTPSWKPLLILAKMPAGFWGEEGFVGADAGSGVFLTGSEGLRETGASGASGAAFLDSSCCPPDW